MDVFSNLMVIGECLLDTRRTKAFKRAIGKTVRKGDIVADIGTGSGILAMMSAKAGAKHVYAVDIAPDIVHFAKQNIKTNGLDSIISTQHSDAKKFAVKTPLDVVTMELMDTWLIAEQQSVVLNELRKNNTIDDHTKLIPYRYQCVATLISYDFSFYGFTMPFVIQARNFAVREHIQARLSPRVVVNDVDFRKHIQTNVNIKMNFPIIKTGRVNAILLESKTFLAPGISLWGTTDMNMPVIIPINEKVVQNKSVTAVSFRNRMGEGFKSFFSIWN